MFATISRRGGRIRRSVFLLVVGHRTIGRARGRAIKTDWRRSMTRSIISKEIVRLVVAINDRSYDQSWPQTIYSCDRLRFGIASFKFWTWPSTLLRLICPLRSPTTSATSRTTSAASRTFFLQFAHDCIIFRSQVGRNLVVSPVWLGFEHNHDLAATDLPLAITHDLCDQSYDLCDQSYVLSTIGPFFGRR